MTSTNVERQLAEAHAMETALITTLQAHVTMAPPGSYRQLLERHLSETRRHAGAIRERLAELGREDDGGPGLITTAIGVAEAVVGQALALGKGPIDLVRGGTSQAEKALKNAKDECATEALEIATYDALEASAHAAGDEQTAALARRHRSEEERMLRDLRDEIPRLAEAVVGGRFSRDAEPIPDYDSLRASEIVARLSTLGPAELRAVAARERAGRARASVLSRIDTLLGQANGSAARDLGVASPR